jgi:hypothetical protein
VIFYTLQGPTYHLEIHEDKIKLIPRGWSRLFTPKSENLEWKLQDLGQFQISVPKLVWGKLEWSTFDGRKGSYRFTTNAIMVSKIEKYLHKIIIKNFNRRQPVQTAETLAQVITLKAA